MLRKSRINPPLTQITEATLPREQSRPQAPKLHDVQLARVWPHLRGWHLDWHTEIHTTEKFTTYREIYAVDYYFIINIITSLFNSITDGKNSKKSEVDFL